MRPVAGSGTVPASEPALGRLRRDLRPVLATLDRSAAEPELLEEIEASLPSLQYALHAAGERAPGLAPSPELRPAYLRLARALEDARDETAFVADALEVGGPDAVAVLVWEWRAALFGVRLALADVEEAVEVSLAEQPPRRVVLPVAPLCLGVAAVLGGALVNIWPIWLVGLVVVAAVVGRTHSHP